VPSGKYDAKWQFPPELRTLSILPRWSIVFTHQRDYVAGHSFFTTLYARAIARLIRWPGNMGDLLFRALVHDAEESIVGDVVSPVKSQIIDDKRAEEYIYLQMQDRMPFIVEDLDTLADTAPDEDSEAWDIVKAADKLDALIFLVTEVRLGNGVVQPHLPRAWGKAEACWRALPANKDHLDFLWSTCIVPAVKLHETLGGAGVAE
jgi:5'-deoxynucleotidase YfbR-like HD superfamily hydrolase